MSVQPGDQLVSVDTGWGGPTIRGYGTVKRVTPAGIVVLDDDVRLKPSRWKDGQYEVRGASGWHRQTYYTPDHEVVAEAHINTRKRKAADAVITAFEDWRSSRDAGTARTLAKAAREFAKGCGA